LPAPGVDKKINSLQIKIKDQSAKIKAREVTLPASQSNVLEEINI